MRITSSHHSSLSSASLCRFPFRCLGFLLILLLITMQSGVVYAQSEGLVLYWKKQIIPGPGSNVYEYVERIVQPVGDQNGDGINDFIISTSDSLLQIFAGGNPMDTIPFMKWKQRGISSQFLVHDINRDGHNDFIHIYQRYGTRERISLYLGGAGVLDSIPDRSVYVPSGAMVENYGAYACITDFNGDGNPELFSWCQNVYNTTNLNGTILMHNIYPHPPYIDSLPTILLTGDTLGFRKYIKIRSGDLNGDGKSDIIVQSISHASSDSLFQHVFVGNSQFEFIENQIIKPSDYGAYGPSIIVNPLGDINNDKKTDLLHTNFGNTFPYWYTDCISYGSFPIVLTGAVGINTANTGVYTSYLCGDINKDGYVDFITRTAMDDYSQLYLGGHMNKLLPVMHFWGGDRSAIVPVGDINCDGAADIGAFRFYTIAGAVVNAGMEIYLGDTTLVSVKDAPSQEKDTSQLEINAHPNPFNSQTNIRFEVSQDARVTITVHNILGQEITKEVYEAKGTTEFSYQLEATRFHLASGMYIITATATSHRGEFIGSSSVKVQLVK